MLTKFCPTIKKSHSLQTEAHEKFKCSIYRRVLTLDMLKVSPKSSAIQLFSVIVIINLIMDVQTQMCSIFLKMFHIKPKNKLKVSAFADNIWFQRSSKRRQNRQKFGFFKPSNQSHSGSFLPTAIFLKQSNLAN